MSAVPTSSPTPSSPHVMHTYGRLPIALTHGQGCRVWDTTGKGYLDALGGIAVNSKGARIEGVQGAKTAAGHRYRTLC